MTEHVHSSVRVPCVIVHYPGVAQEPHSLRRQGGVCPIHQRLSFGRKWDPGAKQGAAIDGGEKLETLAKELDAIFAKIAQEAVAP